MSVEADATMTSAEVGRVVWDRATDFPAIHQLRDAVRQAQQQVLEHPIYRELHTIEDLITFTEYHVFAVWDFMCLLKWLQRRFTCVELPWVPGSSTLACRLMNEIVLAEESDTIGLEYLSHFELYLAAMDDLGADTKPIRAFVKLLREGVTVPAALDLAGAPAAASVFVKKTWEIVESCGDHEVASAFALTREDLIPQMFERVISAHGVGRDRMQRFVEYLERHIQIDAEEHTPMAFELLVELCGDDMGKWDQCANLARDCYQARYDLWTGVTDELAGRRSEDELAYEVLAAIDLGETGDSPELDVIVRSGRVQLWSSQEAQSGQPRFELALPAGRRASDVSAVVQGGKLEIRVARVDVLPGQATWVEVVRA